MKLRWPKFPAGVVRLMVGTVLIVSFGAGIWGLVWWIRYPRTPKVATDDLNEVVSFIGNDDFNRLTESHRKRFVMAIADRLRQEQFQKMVELMTTNTQNRMAAGKNVMKLQKSDLEDIGTAYMRVFLDKFYELSKNDRDLYLTTFVMAEKAGQMGRRSSTRPSSRPAGMQLPTPEKLEQEMTRMLSTQPPRTVAQMGQMMEDMRRRRMMLGMKQPWQ